MVWERRMLWNRVLVESREPNVCHVAMLAGVHGDERAGFHAFERLLGRLGRQPLLRGRVSLLPGNLRAAARKRPTRCAGGQDMNRLFAEPEVLASQGLEPRGPDWERAQELAPLLRDVDVLLDLHSTSAPSKPFAVVDRLDDATLALLSGMPLDRVDYGYRGVLPGTTMECVERHGGRAITVECGAHGQASGAGARVAFASAVALLRNLGMLAPGPSAVAAPAHRTRLVHRGLIRHPASLQYEPWFKSGARVAPGQVLARDRTGTYEAPTRDSLAKVFGSDNVPESLVAIMVTSPTRVARVKPHDAFLLGVPEG
jgi:predicted deacylase